MVPTLDFPGGTDANTPVLLMQGTQVQSLVREQVPTCRPHATIKTWGSQINMNIFLKKKEWCPSQKVLSLIK